MFFQEVKAGLLNVYRLCSDETKLQIKWCQLAVLSLNATQVSSFNPSSTASVSRRFFACTLRNAQVSFGGLNFIVFLYKRAALSRALYGHRNSCHSIVN